jgi:hypothetical protein
VICRLDSAHARFGEKAECFGMARQIERKSKLAWLLLVAGLAVALLMWLEWLGSEQPMRVTEIPVQAPTTKAGSRN